MWKLKYLCRFKSCQSGNALIEFAFIATLLMITVVGAIEFMAVMSQSTKIANAARAGAEQAIKDPAAVSDITNVAARSGELEPTTLNVIVNTFCECPGEGPVACGETCSGGITNYSYVTVNVSQPAQSYFEGAGFLGGFNVSKSATLQLR